MPKRQSDIYTLYGDLDGMAVRDLITLLESYPEDARIDVRSENVYGYGGWSDQGRECFVVQWHEDNI